MRAICRSKATHVHTCLQSQVLGQLRKGSCNCAIISGPPCDFKKNLSQVLAEISMETLGRRGRGRLIHSQSHPTPQQEPSTIPVPAFREGKEYSSQPPSVTLAFPWDVPEQFWSLMVVRPFFCLGQIQ